MDREGRARSAPHPIQDSVLAVGEEEGRYKRRRREEVVEVVEEVEEVEEVKGHNCSSWLQVRDDEWAEWSGANPGFSPTATTWYGQDLTNKPTQPKRRAAPSWSNHGFFASGYAVRNTLARVVVPCLPPRCSSCLSCCACALVRYGCALCPLSSQPQMGWASAPQAVRTRDRVL